VRGSIVKRCQHLAVLIDGKHQTCPCKSGAGRSSSTPGVRTASGSRRWSGVWTRREAEAALTAALTAAGHGDLAHDGGQKVGDYLEHWVEEKIETGLRVTTARSYRGHVARYLKPHLGHLKLRDLKSTHVQAMLLAIARPSKGTSSPPQRCAGYTPRCGALWRPRSGGIS